MATRKLESAQWKQYFDDVSRHLPATDVELRVESEDLGDQLVLKDASLMGLDYDARDQALFVVTPDKSHRITAPREVNVEESAQGLNAVQIIDAEGRQHIVQLSHPLQLRAG